MDLGLTDRVYVITGASTGLGRATAGQLVAEGARVVICSRNPEKLATASAELGGPEHALALPGDLSEPGTEGRLAAAAMARFGRLDGALISVGGPPPGALNQISDEAWRAAFETVFLGAVRVARTVANSLTTDGSIAFVLSSSVRSPIEGLAISNGLRPGVAMVAKSMADELGPRGIRVNGLLPGRIETDRIRELDAASGRPVATRRDAESRIPLGRSGDPAEFGRVAAFVLSPAASYLSGAMIAVDGGAARTF